MALSHCCVRINEQQRELVEHGTAAFPIACYHDDLIREEVVWHWHEEMELILVSEGTSLVVVGSEKYTIPEGNGIFINSGVLHAAYATDAPSCRFHSIVFHPRLVGGSRDSIFWQKYLQPLLKDASCSAVYYDREVDWQRASLDALEEAWQACVQENEGFEFYVRERMSQIILRLADKGVGRQDIVSEKSVRNEERMKNMLQYIHEHYMEELNTTQIAESASISASECLRCFHAMIGTTPIQYVKQYRILCAAELLKSTSMKVVDIGMNCGFQDMSYFSKTFREMRGCTPQQYRKKVKQTANQRASDKEVI